MFIRALSVWVALLALAIVKGAARELWLIPLIGGPAGRAVSTLSVLVLVTTLLAPPLTAYIRHVGSVR